MAATPQSVKEVLADLASQLTTILIAHERLTEKAIEVGAQLELYVERQRDLSNSSQTRAHVTGYLPAQEDSDGSAKSPSHDIAALEEALQRQTAAANLLRQLLYELESLILRLTVTDRLFNSLSFLGVELLQKSDFWNLEQGCSELATALADVEFGKLKEGSQLYSDDVAGTAKHDAEQAISVPNVDAKLFYNANALCALDESANHAARVVSQLVRNFESIDKTCMQSYKDSLSRCASDLPVSQLTSWLGRNRQVVNELEKLTTSQREDVVLWLGRTEIAYGKNNEHLAGQAWQRKQEYDTALSKIEAALVAHVEAGALVNQRIDGGT